MDVMKQTILNFDTDFLRIELSDHKSDEIPYKIEFRNRLMHLHSLIPIGPNVIQFIQRYIENKEGKPNNMSSCFLYHAAASIPQALVYATEIVCVLLGYKSLTLVHLYRLCFSLIFIMGLFQILLSILYG